MALASPVPELVERERELEQFTALLERAGAGEGALLLLEAPAGQGKTALLRALRAAAREAGLRTLFAVGAELEREFSFGVVRQLLEPEVHGADEARRARLFDGAAQLAQPLFTSEAAIEETADTSFARLHGLYWLVANLAEEQPLAIIVDDAHWADSPSMRFIDVLARRIEGLPVVLAAGTRPADPGADQEVLDNLLAAPSRHLVRPRPLSVDAVGELVRGSLGESVDEGFVATTAETTAGSPLLVRELLRTLVDEGFTGGAEEISRLRTAVPGNVERIVAARLRRVSSAARALARAIVVLGDGARLKDAQKLAEMEAAVAAQALRELQRASLVDGGEIRFMHPIVRAAAAADLIGGEREDLHRRAARIRADAGADPVEVATHLLLTEPAGEPWAAETLATAGRRALLDGEPEVAVRRLRRALAEPPASDDRASVLLALGQAEARAGAPDAVDHLTEAAACGDRELAVQADSLRAQVLLIHERVGESVGVLRRALEAAAAQDARLAQEVENDLIDVLAHHPPLREEYLSRLEEAAAQQRPTMLSHLAFVRAITGAPRDEVVRLALEALRPDWEDADDFIHFYALEALMHVEAADEAAAALKRATRVAERAGSWLVAGPLTYMPSSWVTWERAFGDLRHAEELAREGLELTLAARAPALIVTLRTALAAVQLDRGDVDNAEEHFRLLGPREHGPGLRESHTMRARLRLLQGRFEEALAELETEFELERQRGWVVWNREPSRPTQVRALLGLGRREEAREIAESELATAQPRGIPGREARARVTLALTLETGDAVDELRQAAHIAASSPSRAAQAESIGELGAALRRAGERTAARERLSEARELAHRRGATALERRLHDELVVAGARPRRVAMSGVESLTASERRVAELAAEGQRNREIAQTLFVSLKTVEVHLGHVYGKLGIRSRAQLSAALHEE